LRNDKTWNYLEMATGHDAMITEPQLLAKLLLELAGITATGESHAAQVV